MQTAAMDVTFFDREVETLPRERLTKLQEAKLAAVVTETYGSNRFVTDKLAAAGVSPQDVRTLEDLAGLPFTTKTELLAAQDEGSMSANCTFPEAAYTRIHQTSGTTGSPLRVFDTPRTTCLCPSRSVRSSGSGLLWEAQRKSVP